MPSAVSDSGFEAALSALTVRLGLGELGQLRHLSGGASKQTWAFRAGDTPMVVRRDGEANSEITTALPLASEAALMVLAGEAGVPSPNVLYVLNPEDGLGAGFIMSHVDGETLGGRIVRSPTLDEVRPRLAFQCGQILARIHAIAVPGGLGIPLKPASAILEELREVHRLENRPRPVFELAFRCLVERAPEVDVATLVHGDFRNGNMIIGADGVRAVLDWELAQLGDPMQDLGWLCTNSWRFGNIDLPVGGFGRRDDLFSGYESAGGTPVDPERVRYWEIFGSLRWGLICTMSTIKFRERVSSGVGQINVDLPMIARRASETELDLVNLLRATP